MEKNLKLCKENTTLFPFSINKEIDAWLPLEERVSFPKSFSYLRKKLQIKQSRKTHIDSILKKCKARFFKAISDCIKQCVKIQIKKFPQSFITNISIEYNKYILKLTVYELYQIFNLSKDVLDESNENCFFSGKERYFKYIYYSKLSDLYISYIQSKRYKREIESIKYNLGMKMLLLYEFVSENFVNYYTFSQPHLCKNNNLKHNDKKGEKEKDNDLSSQNNISEGILTNEI
jgi:hypothetical protein